MKQYWTLFCEFTPLWILVVALLLLSSACGSSRKSVERIGTMKIEKGHISSNAELVIKDNLITEFESVCEDVEVTHTVYDTSKAEGPQRILSQTTYKGSKKKDVRNDTRSEESKVEANGIEERIAASDSIVTRECKTREETTLPKQMKGMFVAAGFLVLMIILLILVLKHRKKNLHL